MAVTVPPGTAVLWLGNDFRAPDPVAAPARPGVDVVVLDMGGNDLGHVADTAMTGVAFDGTNLWFSAAVIGGSAVLTRRKLSTPDTVDATFMPIR